MSPSLAGFRGVSIAPKPSCQTLRVCPCGLLRYPREGDLYLILEGKMIKLVSVEIEKYKCFQKKQTVEIEKDITTLVGMNESGKTSFLTALSKTNYFTDDSDFKFDETQDYPRNELIDFEDGSENGHILSCTYEMDKDIKQAIENDLGKDVFTETQFSQVYAYRGDHKCTVSGISANLEVFLHVLLKNSVISEETRTKILEINSSLDIDSIVPSDTDTGFQAIKGKIAGMRNASSWDDRLSGYVYFTFIKPKLPKFWYYDDYYPLPGKINITRLASGLMENEKDKTAKALFELAHIVPKEIIAAPEKDYEKYIALLEASANKITHEVFKYWTTNKNLDIDFKIQEMPSKSNQAVKEKYLDIRVKNTRYKVTLPLDRRSRGFNWFFSFIVWFSKIQADTKSDFILLLDEPGLNLHASAQSDLLRFINDLSKKYQIVYTTHSPFMIENDYLNRVRTCIETDEGAFITEAIQQKDPNTLFPLQAALGYDIAQNLFISKNNLLVEGPADLLYITYMSNILEAEKRVFLNEYITIIPVGGLDKVSTFISLLRGSKLNIVCLLDTFTDQKGKKRIEDLIARKIIRDKQILFFHEFAPANIKIANIEDMFERHEYLNFFNESFDGEYQKIEITSLAQDSKTIIEQINNQIKKDRFNHYRPAMTMCKKSFADIAFSQETLNRFERMFVAINKLFE
jgi:predicted ATPase